MITFREERSNGDVIEHKIASDEVGLDEVLEQFEYFLKGCSYVFDGHVDIIKDEEDNESFYFDPSTANQDLNFDVREDVLTFGDSDSIDLWNVDGDNMNSGHVDVVVPFTINLDDTYGATTTKLKDD